MADERGKGAQPLGSRGRGAGLQPRNRYAHHHVEAVDDGWGTADEEPAVLRTQLNIDHSRSVISYNRSPDVGFDRSINPYRGCEHGCVYCFARPTHAYLDLSPGLDFESRLFYKPAAPQLLAEELAKPNYRCAPMTVGINTDAYQPVERKLGLTRALLEVLTECKHPYTIVTKSALIERDLDLLATAAAGNRVSVMLSITSLDRGLARRMEPRAAAPQRRLLTIERLAAAGVPVGVLVAPVIPVLSDPELESILAAAHSAGARWAGYVLLRLPLEIKDLFADWLQRHYPDSAQHVMNRVCDMRGGRAYDARFGARMRGTGVFADLLAQRFKLAVKRLGFAQPPDLDVHAFQAPRSGPQMSLF